MVQRVFIVWTHPLFYETVRLLINHPAIEIVGASPEYAAARVEIGNLQPEIIIIEETENGAATGTEVLQILETSPWRPRVIRLSLKDNELWVYYHERWTVGSSEELLRLVKGK